MNLGAYLYQHGRQAEAIPQYKLAASLASDTRLRATAYADLGTAYYDLGDDAKAEASFDRALRSNPNQVNAWLGIALLAQRLGNVEGEINALAHLLTLQPSAQGYLQLGTLLAQANHRAEALAAYQQALRIAPDLNEAREAAEELQR